jgi:hypothetical protein
MFGSTSSLYQKCLGAQAAYIKNVWEHKQPISKMFGSTSSLYQRCLGAQAAYIKDADVLADWT